MGWDWDLLSTQNFSRQTPRGHFLNALAFTPLPITYTKHFSFASEDFKERGLLGDYYYFYGNINNNPLMKNTLHTTLPYTYILQLSQLLRVYRRFFLLIQEILPPVSTDHLFYFCVLFFSFVSFTFFFFNSSPWVIKCGKKSQYNYLTPLGRFSTTSKLTSLFSFWVERIQPYAQNTKRRQKSWFQKIHI